MRAEPRPGKVFFTNSGAEANEAALKLTRRTGRTHLVAAEGSFHGRTMGSLALTSKAAYREPFEPLPGPRHLRAVRRLRGAGRGRHRRDGRRGARADPGRGGRRRTPRRLPGRRPPDHPRARRPAVARRGADRDRADRRSGSRPRPTPRSSPTSSPSPRASAAASRSVPASASAPPATCSSPATTAPRSAATRSPAPPRWPSSTPSRTRACSPASPTSGSGSAAGLAAGPARHGGARPGLLIGLDVTVDAPAVVAAARAHGFIVNATGPHTVRLAPPLVLGDDDVDAFRAAWPAILDDAAADRSPPMTRHFLRDDDLSPAEQQEVLASPRR